MPLPQNLTPMLWPSGPLEISRRQKDDGFSSAARQTLERWHTPESLEILKDTPINCLVVSWAAGLPQDGEQQKTLSQLVDAARKRNMEVIGWVEDPADYSAAIREAESAGLSAVAIQDFEGKSDFPVIPWGERTSAPWNTTESILPITYNVWPGVVGGAGDDADAGPTGVPWIDSNGWYILLARARTKSRIWTMFDPPGEGAVLQARDYTMAICDSEAAGGRWVISLDDKLRSGLTGGNTASLQTWKEIANTAAFFDQHREWNSYSPLGVVGVISDFTGENYDMSGEILNLMARRDLLFRVIWKSQVMEMPFNGLKALIYADVEPPSSELRQKMLAFVKQNGLLVTGHQWGPEGTSTGADVHPRYDVRNYGKGRLAVAKEELYDPFQVAADAQILLSHSNDLMKLYNLGSSGCSQYTASPDGETELLQLMNYSSRRRGDLITVWTQRNYTKAQLWTIEQARPVPLRQMAAENGGIEFQLPSMPSYGALEFEV